MAIYQRNPTHFLGHIVICLSAIVFMGCLDIYTTYIEEGDYENFMNERRTERLILADAAVTLPVRRIERFKPIYLNRKLPNPEGTCAAIAGIASLLSIKKAAQYFQSPSSDFNELLQTDGGIWNGKYEILKDYAVIIKQYFDPSVATEKLRGLCFLTDWDEKPWPSFRNAGLPFKEWIEELKGYVKGRMKPYEFNLQLMHRFIYQLIGKMYIVKYGETVGFDRFLKNFPWYYSLGPQLSQEFKDHEDKAVILDLSVLDLEEALSHFEPNYQLQTVFLFVTNEFRRIPYYQELRKRKPIALTEEEINDLSYDYHCIAMVRSVDGKRWIARETDYDTRSYGEDLETAIKNEKKFLRERQEKIREALHEEFLIGHASQIGLLEASFEANPYNIEVSGGFIGSLIVEDLKWSDDSPVNVDTR